MKLPKLFGLLLVVGCNIGGGAENLAPPNSVSSEVVQVEEVVDGDSFRTINSEVRLIGVNAPERDECYGTESREWLAELVEDKDVEIVPDSIDQFGRILADVKVDDISLNREAVATGHALAVTASDHLDDEDVARQAGLGLWGADICGASGAPPNLVIDDILFDPPGDDREELIVIGNRSEAAIDLAGFQLRDESSVNRYAFPSYRLAPGGIVTVSTGCDAAANVLNWCTLGPVWNNGGDAVILLDSFGRVVAFRRY
ncbi:MAG: lamin tail domain-containing protein [Acidimicrobiia bacterium]